MKMIIKTIPHNSQRYDTCGDYWEDADGVTQFRISEMPDQRYMWLVAIHELIEHVLAKQKGITNTQIDEFDMAYEAARREGDTSEPGDDIGCPVYKQHQFATGIEKILAAELDVSWNEYEDTINRLGDE